MPRYLHKELPLKTPKYTKKVFTSTKNARLGTQKSPARISVQTDERKQELLAICAENTWASVITVDPEQEENIQDLEFLQNKQTSAVSIKKANRNDPCPCGSGKKYKRCCGA